MIDREALRAAVLAALQAELNRQTDAALDARDESISEESRAENKYDTHAQEAAYLAEGQARLATEHAAAIAAWRSLVFPALGHDVVVAGSVVTLVTGARRERWLLGPAGGGLEIAAPDGGTVTVITPSAPLGRTLAGRRAGDVVPALRRSAPPARIERID